MERRRARKRDEANPRKPGFFSIELDSEFGRAWKLFLLDNGGTKASHFRALMEEFLVKEGYLKVLPTRDPKTGKETKTYEALRGED